MEDYLTLSVAEKRASILKANSAEVKEGMNPPALLKKLKLHHNVTHQRIHLQQISTQIKHTSYLPLMDRKNVSRIGMVAS